MEWADFNIISYCYEPQETPRAYRALELARGFCEAGCSVRVIHPDLGPVRFTHPRLETISIPLGLLNRVGDEVFLTYSEGSVSQWIKRCLVRICDLAYWPNYQSAWSHLAFSQLLRSRAGGLASGGTLSIGLPMASHVLSHLLVRSHRFGDMGPLVMEFGDPFLRRPPHDNSKEDVRRERQILDGVGAIVVPHEGALEPLARKEIDLKKVHIIPQAYRIDHAKRTARAAKRPPLTGKLRGVYGGVLYHRLREPTILLKAIKQAIDLGADLSVSFYLDAPSAILLRSWPGMREIPAGAVEILPRLTRSEFLSVLPTFDFAINLQNASTYYRPSKVIDFAVAGVPMLDVVADGAAGAVARSIAKREFTVPALAPENDIRNAIGRYRDLFASLKKEESGGGRRAQGAIGS